MNKNLDIIVYGATGFTGGICVKYLKDNYPDINWGIAGRSKEKLISLSNLLPWILKCLLQMERILPL